MLVSFLHLPARAYFAISSVTYLRADTPIVARGGKKDDTLSGGIA
jgi:hypothetical protein